MGFVDEADSFLRKRGAEGDGTMSEHMRNTLSTFLYRTGSASDKVMLVLATNEPSAIDRMDEAVEFALPGHGERAQLLEKYFHSNVVSPSGNAKPINVEEGIEAPATWNALANDIEGFSGRQIMKLAVAWQAAAYATVNNTITPEIMATELAIHKD